MISRRRAAGSGTLAARHRQVHAPCEVETGNSYERRRAEQAHRCGVRGYKGARRKRLAHRNVLEAFERAAEGSSFSPISCQTPL